MSVSQITYELRFMRLTDIPQIVWIDQQSFSTPWSASSYAREVRDSTYSHMLVVERVETVVSHHPLQSFWNWLKGENRVHHTVLSYGGLWLFEDEAHISTIASHPRYRGQGWGELALITMIRRAIMLQAPLVALEVRVSNTRAQALYTKYGFRSRGVKKAYYYDDGEDAFDMVLALQDSALRQRINARYQDYCQHYLLTDSFTNLRRGG